jgi:anti-anti-sigma factor
VKLVAQAGRQGDPPPDTAQLRVGTGCPDHPADSSCRVVTCSGALDLACHDALRAILGQAIDAGATCVVVDLAAVDLIDAATIRVLLTYQRRAAERGRRLRVVHATGLARYVLELTGTYATLVGPPVPTWPARVPRRAALS